MDFSSVENEYRELKAQFDAGQLTEAGFKARLQDLLIEDEQGRWWIIGYETGQWYVHDGEKWVEAEPPRSVPSPSTEPPIAMAGRTEAIAPQTKIAQPAAQAAPAAAVTTPSAPPKTMTWLALALIIVAWGIFGGVPYNDIGDAGKTVAVLLGAIFLTALATGAAVHLVLPAVRWGQVLVVAAAWGMASLPLAFLVLASESVSVSEPVLLGSMLVIGLLGGLAIGLIVKQALAEVRWNHVLIVAACWCIAFVVALFGPVGFSDGNLVVSAIVGAIAGAIGGGVTLWQIRRAQRAAARQT